MKAPTVYVVDDDEAVRDSIKELVESVDLKAETFSSAQSFLESYITDQPGCLVLDVRMAKMSGLALQARLREVGATLPIILVSGHGDINMAVGALKTGAVDFIQSLTTSRACWRVFTAPWNWTFKTGTSPKTRAPWNSMSPPLLRESVKSWNCLCKGTQTRPSPIGSVSARAQ